VSSIMLGDSPMPPTLNVGLRCPAPYTLAKLFHDLSPDPGFLAHLADGGLLKTFVTFNMALGDAPVSFSASVAVAD
jgi:hypothetical protein